MGSDHLVSLFQIILLVIVMLHTWGQQGNFLFYISSASLLSWFRVGQVMILKILRICASTPTVPTQQIFGEELLRCFMAISPIFTLGGNLFF